MHKRLAILISGSGSNLQAFIQAVAEQTLAAEIAVVISNRPAVKGLERAAKAGLATQLIDHTLFVDRQAFDQALQQCIDTYQVDAVVLAGFMRILTPEFVSYYQGRLFNIHPSLLTSKPSKKKLKTNIDTSWFVESS